MQKIERVFLSFDSGARHTVKSGQFSFSQVTVLSDTQMFVASALVHRGAHSFEFKGSVLLWHTSVLRWRLWPPRWVRVVSGGYYCCAPRPGRATSRLALCDLFPSCTQEIVCTKKCNLIVHSTGCSNSSKGNIPTNMGTFLWTSRQETSWR